MTEFMIRHYVPDQDVSVLSQMLTETESIDRDGEETSEEYLRSMPEWPNFDAARNVWVVELDGRMVGYCLLIPRQKSPSTLYIVAHPSQRRKGLGSQLLSMALSRAREAECADILVYAASHNAGSNAFLRQHGFDVVAKSGLMVAPVAELPPLEIPSGYVIRQYTDLRDPVLLAQALDQCYKGMIGHNQNVTSAERYLHFHGEQGIFLLFTEQGKLIGICQGEPEGKRDERGASDLLDAPGLIKEYRRQGLQRLLTLTVMHWLRARGNRPIALEYWGDDEQAIAIYHSLGFELVNQQFTYQKDL